MVAVLSKWWLSRLPSAPMTTVLVTTDTALQAINQHVGRAGNEHFTTHEIARAMGADEYHVRIAFSWLSRYRIIESIPGVRSVRYTGTAGEKYSANVYQLRQESTPADFETLNRVFGVRAATVQK